MRLGSYPCRLVPGTMAAEAYGTDEVLERHRHRYEFNNEYRRAGERPLISGTSPDGGLVEIGELRDHVWMVGSQFHPEFRSRPNRPHPLFAGFLGAAVARSNTRQAPVPTVEPHARRAGHTARATRAR